jgi:benzodiazapine receptor
MKQNNIPAWRRNIDYGAVTVILVLAASVSGQLATEPNLGWYGGLAKPWYTPPSGILAPVWAALYLLMAFAVWRLMRLPPSPLRRLALILFFIQLALNAAWPWMFFAAHSPPLGLINIVPQFLVIVGTILAAARLDRAAALALVPLAAWIGFAGVLNAAVWSLNP